MTLFGIKSILLFIYQYSKLPGPNHSTNKRTFFLHNGHILGLCQVPQPCLTGAWLKKIKYHQNFNSGSKLHQTLLPFPLPIYSQLPEPNHFRKQKHFFLPKSTCLNKSQVTVFLPTTKISVPVKSSIYHKTSTSDNIVPKILLSLSFSNITDLLEHNISQNKKNP